MLTVLIATRNGAATLPRVLASYTQLEPPTGGWKLVVVDNGSTDGTAALQLAQMTAYLRGVRGSDLSQGKVLAEIVHARYLELEQVIHPD